MENLGGTAGNTLTLKEYAEDYLRGVKQTMDEISFQELQEVVDVIETAYRKGNQIFILGNGGSASTASHFACDLGKGTAAEGKPRFKVTSLNDNVALLTAIGNDLGLDDLFSEQLKICLEEGDVVILITGSGNSANLLKAAEYANSRGAITIGFIGFGGGKLREMVQHQITISSRKYEFIEPVHLILEHLISFFFKQEIAAWQQEQTHAK